MGLCSLICPHLLPEPSPLLLLASPDAESGPQVQTSASPDAEFGHRRNLRLARRLVQPQVIRRPRPSSASATFSTVNPAEGHSVNYGARQEGLDHHLG